ncbi:choice-of-anchor J domain-containing protein [Phaeodactylibacter sp.]|jgi:hypothetical protein|uniref:T9SS-dependent choice-of-anchor J family protein n=1 Tax=Phaeodactylibacter sp. TaxID=1940289 RepID=UPI0025CDA46B|nr:choice-of-anchor J domain-containing protein [Phaeodactylibacter sp.]MCI4647124.1 choice-of-anchor J domain-containing protein [Phaeodactylibacter sp.]MCI5092590.1 choice-of-anchor J domain-containing protein [Phaeodactylibacter sp.]
MKNALLIVLLLFAGFASNAQEILLEETFNDGTLGSFTAYSVLGDGQVWEPREFGGRQFAQMNGFDGGIQDNEDWLISPALDMDAQEGEVLTFENASNFSGPDLEVLVSNDYDGNSDPNTATWTNLSDQVNFSTGNYEYVNSGALDLSAISGTGHIAFKYISNTSVDGKLWQIDSVVVSAEMPSNLEEPTTDLIRAPIVRNGQLQFELTGLTGQANCTLYDMTGRFVLGQAAASAGLITMPVRQLSSGIYLLTVQTQGTMQGHKIFIP